MNTNKVHDSIVDALNQIKDMTPDQLQKMYEGMMPDLLHNQKHFFTFADKQQHKIDNLF